MKKINRILFEKPNLAELVTNHTVVDMHFHTRFSDGRNSIKDIVKRARKIGIGIGITDHNSIDGAVELSRYKDILNIPGIEITSKTGTHVLVYFYDVESLKNFYNKDIKPYRGHDVMSSISLEMEEIIRRAKAFKSLTIFPHPYCAAYTGIFNPTLSKTRINRLLDMIDGIEVINAGNLNRWNLKSALLGFNLNKAIIGGSDGHTLSHMGKAVSYARCKKKRKNFLDSIKKKHNKVMGKEIDLFRKFASNSYKMKAGLKNYPGLMEKNIRYSYTVINSTSKRLKANVTRKLDKRRNRHHI